MYNLKSLYFFCGNFGTEKLYFYFWQIDDGVPVYLKSGAGDKILYLATSIGVIVGLGLSGQAFYKLLTK